MKKISCYLIIILLLSGLVLFPGFNGLNAQAPPPPPETSSSIINTKHNLSISGPGTIKSSTEGRMCIFCHAPHHAGIETPYLWNKAISTASYIPYQSSTMFATVGQPSGASKLCLSCHDGTIALGALVSEIWEIPFAGGRMMPPGPANTGTDLSDDHPVSFTFNASLAAANGELISPSSLPVEVSLDSNGQLQCTSCHDPHDNMNGQFLVLPNDYSGLCNSCHQKDGWNLTSHSTSNATWNNLGADPWFHTSLDTVSENGCENCHSPHTAGGHKRLLNYSFDEINCLVCHNGNVAVEDIDTELTKLYSHAVQNYVNIHDPSEDFTGTVQNHVECSDCHNPHRANSDISTGPPNISGAISGVAGINSAGQQVGSAVYQYEICFKCHGDNNVTIILPIDRQLQQLNTRLEFEPSNPSYHPVEIQGVNTILPSLLPPYTTSSIIFCTDCHNNDDSAGPKGPHGSDNEYLLEANYTTQDFTLESPYNYALCYKCHDRNSILGNQSFSGHNIHIVTSQTPCSACHDAHGISSAQGNSINNSHLINFDITIATPNSQGLLKFEDLGILTGSCSLLCHGRDHNPEQYP